MWWLFFLRFLMLSSNGWRDRRALKGQGGTLPATCWHGLWSSPEPSLHRFLFFTLGAILFMSALPGTLLLLASLLPNLFIPGSKCVFLLLATTSLSCKESLFSRSCSTESEMVKILFSANSTKSTIAQKIIDSGLSNVGPLSCTVQ